MKKSLIVIIIYVNKRGKVMNITNKEYVELARKAIFGYKPSELIKIPDELVDEVLFTFSKDEEGNIRKKFNQADSFILNCVDYSNVNFDNFYYDYMTAGGHPTLKFNFENLHNVSINPQTIYQKDLRHLLLKGVQITGSIEGTLYSENTFDGADFTNLENKQISKSLKKI